MTLQGPIVEAGVTGGSILNAMSVDIEDWFQVGAFETVIDRGDWDGLECRVERNGDAVLELFDRAGITATFFTLGWVAERYPGLMRRIAEQGHEIASHGYGHERVFTLTQAQFAANIDQTKKLLEDAGGVPVTGYRAPSFSIDQRTPWAHEILASKGYAYSSSVAPVQSDHYGWPEASRFAFRPVAGADMIELPVTTALFAGKRLAAGGGGWFRMFPYQFSRWAFGQVNREARPGIFYFHPWEIDPEQPRVQNAPLKSKLRHYTNLGRMERKLDRILREFSWGRVDAVAAIEKARLP